MDGSKSILFSFRNLPFYILNFTFEKRSFDSHGLKIRLPKSIEELFGKRSDRRCGQGGKRSAPSAMAPWRDEFRMTEREATRTPAYVTLRGAAKAKPSREVERVSLSVISTEKGCNPAEWRNLARCVSGNELFLPCSSLLLRPIQDPSARSLVSLAPSVGMTEISVKCKV